MERESPTDMREATFRTVLFTYSSLGMWAILFALQVFLPPSFAEDPAPRLNSGAEAEFFQSKVLPLLEARCFECHSHKGKIKGGLALDSRSGTQLGGEGGAVIVPGSPELSRLVTAVQYTDKDLQMPPSGKLETGEIATLVEWVSRGAHDPREGQAAPSPVEIEREEWEALYQKRLGWWSLQPLSEPTPPEVPPKVQDSSWVRNEIDRFILGKLEAEGLKPSREADRYTLARRLSFALTGLPPDPDDVERFAVDPSPTAFDDLVQSYLDSPHFGERWARHWMDVVHYSDTHGYEWDTPSKNAWMYRDYLIRAFNTDIPFNRLVMEQIAGDLIEPRVDAESGLNESLIGPTAMRLGERRHGDNADAEGVSQETVANIIDTLSKGFLGTTVACAQCHDHKLDAVEQRDYYGLAGVLMSSRWIVRSAEVEDPNVHVIGELRDIKEDLRGELVKIWSGAGAVVAERIRDITHEVETKTEDAKKAAAKKVPAKDGFPESVTALWHRLILDDTSNLSIESRWNKLTAAFSEERASRIAENKTNLTMIADFTRKEIPSGWRVDGFGMEHGLVPDGEIVIGDEGDAAIARVVPAGRWSDIWSARLAGAVRSPQFAQESAPTVSVGYAAGRFAAQSVVVDNAFHSERMKFLKQLRHGWLTITAGNFPALAGGPDPTPRRVYLEMVTKSLNNYFPPRSAFGGVTAEDETDERSWFGVTRAYQHPKDKPPLDELSRFAPLFSDDEFPTDATGTANELAQLVMTAVERWSQGVCDSEGIGLINEALLAGWLPNSRGETLRMDRLVQEYRETERRIRPDRVIGSVDDWNEGKDERIGVRGSYTVLGDEVPRGNIRFLGGPGTRAYRESSGRLELARSIASDQNPLTARVFVNRIWHYLFGVGLVRTVDDFGHLGETPSHPELLDWLATRFIDEGWSVKKLVTLMVSSATWRQSGLAEGVAVVADPENRLWHHMPMRRLEAEAIRDAILASSDRLDDSLYGPPVDPSRTAEDPAKRLFSGPLDGNGRRSLYLKMTLMDPPKFLSLFNQPIPKLTTGRRDSTNVPDQALALLNDPFVIAMARHWSEQVMQDGSALPGHRVERMFADAFGRAPSPDETERIVALAERCARLRGVNVSDLIDCQPVWQDVAHAIFNLKEFIYVP